MRVNLYNGFGHKIRANLETSQITLYIMMYNYLADLCVSDISHLVSFEVEL